MFQVNIIRTVHVMIIALLIALSAQIALAVNCLDAPVAPDWVLDRQQYETTFVYTPDDISSAFAPVWNADHYQYDSTYLTRESGMAQNQGIAVPQWVLDRQQYEPTYTYTPEKTVPSEQCSIS